MTDSDRKMLRQFIAGRQEAVYRRLKENTRYLEVCERQKRTDEIVDELLHKLEKDERLTVRRHYEGETERSGIEIYETYLQGLRDSVRILALLGVFGWEVSL